MTRPKSAFIAPSTYASTIENSVEIGYGKNFLEKKPPRSDISYGKKWKEVIVQPAPMPTVNFGLIFVMHSSRAFLHLRNRMNHEPLVLFERSRSD